MSTASLLKGTLQTMILRLLEDHGRMYGYEITQKVKLISDGTFQVTEGALYPALHKLESEGLLVAETEVIEGRARKYYSLTDQGATEVVHKLHEAAIFIEKLQRVLNIQPASI
jgi:PadR family transcriptional regulator PadR